MLKKILNIKLVFYLCCLSYSSLIYSKDLSKAELKEAMAAIINLQGHLCAKVIDIASLKLRGTYEVSCIEYRGGNGKVDYIVKLNDGITVFKR